ncbi:MAG: tripartite tricarboxylate transporter substrate binding protein [Burkholderiales bacterium]|nr:tripartite tricarboxylate transporter substrate binding protein [Burkholderiales bacterium]
MRIASLAGALAALLLGASAAAQPAWPSRPVTLLVGYAAGTGIDTTARFYAERLREATGQQFLVVNKVGAFGNLAAQDVLRAAPDGYTVLVTPNGTLTTNQHLMKKMPFDALKDFAPVATMARWGAILLVNPREAPVSSVAELTALLKAQPGKLNFASGNFTGQAAGELYKIRAGVSATHVPYKGVPAALADLVGGQVQFMFADVVTGLPQVRAGRLRALAVTTPKRLPNAPEIPTMVEAGVPDYALVNWFGVFLPSGAPEALVRRIGDAVNAVTNSPAAQAFYDKVGGEAFPGTAESTRRTIESDIPAWGRLVKAAGIEPE